MASTCLSKTILLSSFSSVSFTVILITLILLEDWKLVACKKHNTTGHHHHHHRPPPPPPAQYNPKWLPATATWYGAVDGAGTDGGACGYGSLESTAYGTMVSAGSPVLFKNGKGCGACYQVKCVGNNACSRSAVRVAITDECPGGYCASGKTHFDMSGSAFSHMATAGHNSSLLNAGVVQVLYRRTLCEYPQGTDIEFVVNEGSSPYWFSVLIKYESGDGDLSQVELMQGNSGKWESMYLLWGAYWCLNEGPLQGPFSLRLTSSSGHFLTASHVIPYNWGPGKVYKSLINF